MAKGLPEALRAWRKDPRIFVRQVFDATPDPWQDEVLAAFPTNQRVALKACKGPGKTTTLAWLIWNFLATRPYPKIPCTSITGGNLRDNLWSEIALWRRRSPFLSYAFEQDGNRVYSREAPENWFAVARAWQRDADAEQQANALAGFHADYLLFVIDEAGGVPDAVAAAAEGGLATGIETKLLIAGNPTHLEGPLYRACTSERPLWYVYEITGDPEVKNRAPRVSIEWARQQIAKYGRDSAYVQVNVFGQFPSASSDAIVALNWTENAFARYPAGRDGAVVLGVDVARYGTDLSTCAVRRGDALELIDDWQGQSITYSRDRVAGLAREHGATEIRVDDVGVGGGLTDGLRELGLPVVPVNVGEAALTPQKFENLRAEITWQLRDRFADGLISLAPAVKPTPLATEASTLRYGFGTGQRIRIEPKDSYRRRTGKSPDFLDATVLAYANLAGAEPAFLGFARAAAAGGNNAA